MSASGSLPKQGGFSSSKMEMEEPNETPTSSRSDSAGSTDSGDSTDSIPHPEKPHDQPQGINIYYHNIKFLGGGPGQPSARTNEVINKLGERVKACAVTLFVEVMDGTRKDEVMTPEQQFEQIVLRIQSIGNSIILKNSNIPEGDIDTAITNYVNDSIKTLLEDNGVKLNPGLREYIEKNLKRDLEEPSKFSKDIHKKREPQAKIDHTKKAWNEFIEESLKKYKPQMSKGGDSKSEEKIDSASASAEASNPGALELERVRKVAGNQYLTEYQTDLAPLQ